MFPMMNLFEIMQNAQGGNAVNNIANQFGLSQNQAQEAMKALLPAFEIGLKQQAQNADTMANFLQNLASGQTAKFHDADGDGIPDDAATAGNDVLGQLFGSKEVSRAVAAQASAMSGLSSTILKSMMPVIASMVMGGLFKGMSNQGFGGLLGQIAGGMFNQGGMMNQAGMNQGAFGNNPLGQILGQMMGAGQPQMAPQTGNPMSDMLGQMMGGLFGGQGQQPQAAPQSDPLKAGLDALTSMFNSGTEVQKNYQDNMGQLLQQMLGGARR
jgi:hypothetical protein